MASITEAGAQPATRLHHQSGPPGPRLAPHVPTAPRTTSPPAGAPQRTYPRRTPADRRLPGGPAAPDWGPHPPGRPASTPCPGNTRWIAGCRPDSMPCSRLPIALLALGSVWCGIRYSAAFPPAGDSSTRTAAGYVTVPDHLCNLVCHPDTSTSGLIVLVSVVARARSRSYIR